MVSAKPAAIRRYSEPGFSRGIAAEVDNDFVARQWFAAPIHTDMTKHAVFDLVPLAGSRWEVTDRDQQAGFIGQGL
jgi:hypothetical protein